MTTEKLKHPKGLALLFVTEMWERFSFYGMQAIFYLYMINALVLEKTDADLIYGNYNGMVYITAIIGGIMADRLLGNQKSILIGGIIMAVGQFLLFISGLFFQSKSIAIVFLFLGLIFLCLGSGFFKPNISAMVGQLYPKNDKRIDSAFTIFYMGVNLGALLAPIVCGFLGNTGDMADFKWAYLATSIGMVISVIVFSMYKSKYLISPEGIPIGLPQSGTKKNEDTQIKNFTSKDFAIIAAIFIMLYIIFKIILNVDYIGAFIYTTFLTVPISIITDNYLTVEEKKKIIALFILIIFSMVFWAAWGQLGSSVTYFADKSMNRDFLGINIPPSVFRLFGPLFIVIFAPLMAALWTRLAKRNLEPSIPAKLAIGLLLMSLSWVMLIIGVNSISPGIKVGMIWLIMMYFIYTMGELSLSPIGLSMVYKLSPVKFATILMAVFFLSLGTAFKLSGVMSALYPQEVSKSEIPLMDNKIIVKSYNSLYEIKPDSSFFSRLNQSSAYDPMRVWEAKIYEGKLQTIEEEAAKTIFNLDSVKLDAILSSDDSYKKEKTKFIYRFSSDGKNLFLLRNDNVLERWNLYPDKPRLFWIEIKSLTTFFMIFVLMAGIASILLFALTKPLLKMMQGVR